MSDCQNAEVKRRDNICSRDNSGWSQRCCVFPSDTQDSISCTNVITTHTGISNLKMDNFYSRCLLCTCRPDVTPHLHIFSQAGKQLHLPDKLKYLNIQIDAELPQNVCHSCMEKLEVTHELVTSSQQARIMLLQMKQQSEEVKQENCSMTELDSYQPATDSAAIDNEIIGNEIPMDNCSAEDFDQSDSALHCTTEDTVEQTEEFEEVLISKIEIEEHAIKLEAGEDQLDCLPQNSQCRDVESSLDNKLHAECQVLVPKLLECDFCCFYSDNKSQLATHMQAHLHTPNTSDGSRRHPANESRIFNLQCAECGIRYTNSAMGKWHTENCHGTDAVIKMAKLRDKQQVYQCVFCATECVEVNKIIQHLRRQHQIRNLPLHCNACNLQFSRRENLRNHQQFSCKSKTVSCSRNLLHDLEKHIKNVESKQSGVKCKLYSEVFKSEDLMKSHISEFHAVKRVHNQCLHCEESFRSIQHLKSHCLSRHPGKHVFQCDLCNVEFSSYSSYNDHKKLKHKNHVYTCGICKVKFNSRTGYNDHKKFKHENRTLTCSICNKIFVSRPGYIKHKKYTHGNHVFTCNICSATFSSPDSLRVHTKSKHSLSKKSFS